MQKVNLNRILKDLEIEYVKKALEAASNNVTRAAELLGLKRTALQMRLKFLDIVIPRAPKRVKENKEIITNPFLMKHVNCIEADLYNE